MKGKAQKVVEILNSTAPFADALRSLMAERKISYRRLATRTKLSAGYLNHLACGTRPVPANPVIKVIARALRVKPEHFFEYRQRGLRDELYRYPDLADQLYDYIVADKPAPGELKAMLDSARKK